MIKVILNAYEKTSSFEVKATFLKTKDYSKRLYKNEIHVPHAAKLILIFETEKMKALYLSSPIINVHPNGDITIWTDLKLKDILENQWIKKLNSKDLKNKLKTLNKKQKIGLTIKEIMKISHIESKLELFVLKQNEEKWEKETNELKHRT